MSLKFSEFTDASALDSVVGLTSGENAIVTRAEFKTSLSLAKGDVGLGSVDNTSDATKNAASVTLTNHTISGASNTLTNIAESSVTNLTTDLAAKAVKSGSLAQFVTECSSSELAGLLSDETGDGVAVFSNSPALTGTPTAPTAGAGTNDTRLATTAFVTDAVATSLSAAEAYADGLVTGLLDFKGSTDCSANPDYPVGLKGDAYYVSVAGKIGGASGKSVEVGDVYVASADNAGGAEGSVGTSWFVLEHNLVGAAVTSGTLAQFASTTSAQLRGVLSDETGAGAAVFADTPTLIAPILGTPTSGTLTNCTGLPVAGIAASTSTALGVGSLELGHASDTTLSRSSAGRLAVEGVNVVTVSSTDSLSNKSLVAPALGTAASGDITACSGRLFGIGMALSGTAATTTGDKGAETIGVASKVVSIYLNVIAAPTGSNLIVNIKKNGTTIFSTKISIDTTETNSSTAATPYVLSSSPTTFAVGDVVSYHIDQLDSGATATFLVCDILLVTT